MKNILPDSSSKLSKMWTKIKNIENSLFPELKEQFGVLSSKEERLIKILDFAQIENSITVVKITNPPKDREEHPKGISSLWSGHSKSFHCQVCL